MLIEGFLTDTKRSSDSDLNIYCRIEGVDYHYLAAGMHKKRSRKATVSSRKKLFSRKLFGY